MRALTHDFNILASVFSDMLRQPADRTNNKKIRRRWHNFRLEPNETSIDLFSSINQSPWRLFFCFTEFYRVFFKGVLAPFFSGGIDNKKNGRRSGQPQTFPTSNRIWLLSLRFLKKKTKILPYCFFFVVIFYPPPPLPSEDRRRNERNNRKKKEIKLHNKKKRKKKKVIVFVGP